MVKELLLRKEQAKIPVLHHKGEAQAQIVEV